jgi:hypothetical protein
MSSCRTGITACRPPLLRFTCLPKAPLQPGVVLVRRSRHAVRPLHGFRHEGTIPVTRTAIPSSDFALLQSLAWYTRITCVMPALSRFSCPFDATQPIRATAPGVSTPESCCVLPLTMRFDALLPKRPPRCLSTRRVLGVQFPSELAQTEITTAFRQRYPLVRLANR